MKVESVREIPQVRLAPHSAADFALAPTQAVVALIKKSPDLWTITVDGHIILIAGVMQYALVGVSELWVLVTEDFRADLLRNIRHVRKLVPELLSKYPRVRMNISDEESARFARVFGFVAGGERVRVGLEYEIWRPA